MYAATLPTYRDRMVMDTRTGWMPVCGAVLVCSLTILSIRAWNGADLRSELDSVLSYAGLLETETGQRKSELQISDISIANRLANLPPRTSWEAVSQAAHQREQLGHLRENVGSAFVPELHDAEVDTTFDLASYASRASSHSNRRRTVKATTVSFSSPANTVANTTEQLQQQLHAAYQSFHTVFAILRAALLVDIRSQQIDNNNQSSQLEIDPGNNEQTLSTTSRMPNAMSTEVPYEAAESASARSTTWALPKALLDDLESLTGEPYIAAWAESTIQILGGLQHLDGIADSRATLIFSSLERQLDQLEFLIRQVSTSQSAVYAQGELATRLRHLRYAIQRRLEIWPLVNRIAGKNVDRIGLVDNRQVGSFLQASNLKLNTAAIEKGWADYLQIQQAADTFNSLNTNEFELRKAARKVLARLNSPSLSLAQQQYLQQAIDDTTTKVLRVSATELVEMEQFLKRLERLEQIENGATRFYLNDHYQSLLWSDDQDYQELAARIQTHYRNANFRVSVSEIWLNRMVPRLPDTREPFQDTVMQAQIRGQNRISTQMKIALIPDPNQISMRLETYGNVQSHTTASRDGVVIENEGNSRFRIIKRLAFGQHGIFAYRPEVTSQIRQRVVGLRSNLDKIPPLGWVKRKIASNKIDQQTPMTNRYVRNQVESRAEAEFNKHFETQLQQLETTLTENLLHPLIAMDLEPDPVQISTTADRINLRYRLAGRDQMASTTARPRAMQGCLMSMQIHESAVNNIISRFELAGKKFTSTELAEYVNRMFQTEFVTEDGRRKKEANFHFAPFDPVRIDFDTNQIAISINLKSLQIGKGKRWKNLNLKAIYDPTISDGFRVQMVQSEEGLRIKGKRFNAGDQLAIGVICEVLFPNEFEFAMMPKHLGQQLKVDTLQASQFVVSNGWIGLSVDDAPRNTLIQPAQRTAQPRQRARR